MLRIKAQTWRADRFPEIGRGGEAVVYRLRNDLVAKVFLLPTAPEYADNKALQEAASVRIREMQTKLLEFPEDVPEGLVTPYGVLVSPHGNIFGYAMSFVDGVPLDKLSRTSSGCPSSMAGLVLVRLHELVSALHERGIVVGDLNENNIIVSKQGPRFIDADSMQFGQYPCRAFMPRFTAPELLEVDAPRRFFRRAQPPVQPGKPVVYKMVAPHSELTDWYSFLVIAMRVLTFTDPYGGVAPNMSFEERYSKRVTVFDRQVTYPRVARPLSSVPRPILELFFRAFHRGERFVPDKELFSAIGAHTT